MNAEAIALFVAGIIAPIVIQRLKGSALAGRWALWFAVAVSLALATVAQLLTGGIPGPEESFAAAAAVFAISQIVYRQFFKPALEV